MGKTGFKGDIYAYILPVVDDVCRIFRSAGADPRGSYRAVQNS
jgi:hypothetical protein